MPVAALEAVAGDWSRDLGGDCSSDGYRVPFTDSPPPLARTPVSFPTYRAGSPRAQALQQEVEAMLAKGALEIARDPGPGFYSRLFLVEKATGGWRPVIDLSHLNDFVQLTSFKMETVALVLLSVKEGDFLASLDLKDAYFQIPIHGSSRKLLRFMSEGTVYQFKALCFGLSTAPQVFTRVFAAVSAWAHSRRIRLLRYLDDWLVLSSSEKKAKQSIRELLSLCHTLGIVINEKKSDLVPSQSAKYLGMTIDTGAGKVFPSLARVEKFLAVAERFCSMQSSPAQLWQVILGHLASLERLVPHSRLRMRSLQWHLKTQWFPESDPPSLPVALPEEARRDLSWWMVKDHLLTGDPSAMSWNSRMRPKTARNESSRAKSTDSKVVERSSSTTPEGPGDRRLAPDWYCSSLTEDRDVPERDKRSKSREEPPVRAPPCARLDRGGETSARSSSDESEEER